MHDLKPKIAYIRAFCGFWGAAIAVLSLLPAKVALTTGWSDKIEHALAFAVLAGLARLGWHRHPAFLTLALCVFYGVMIELAQTLSPGRHADVWDVGADAVGAGLGILAVKGWLIVGKRSRNRPDQ